MVLKTGIADIERVEEMRGIGIDQMLKDLLLLLVFEVCGYLFAFKTASRELLPGFLFVLDPASIHGGGGGFRGGGAITVRRRFGSGDKLTRTAAIFPIRPANRAAGKRDTGSLRDRILDPIRVKFSLVGPRDAG